MYDESYTPSDCYNDEECTTVDVNYLFVVFVVVSDRPVSCTTVDDN